MVVLNNYEVQYYLKRANAMMSHVESCLKMLDKARADIREGQLFDAMDGVNNTREELISMMLESEIVIGALEHDLGKQTIDC